MTVTNEPSAREMIPALLDAARPDRYDPTDKTWMSPVVDMVADCILIEEARSIAAVRLVSVAEATATKGTNRLLREIAETGAWPLDWFDAMRWPLAVEAGERVALRAASAEDFRKFAARERRAASLDFTSRNESCEGALFVADAMEAQRVERAFDLQLPDGEAA